MQKWKESPTDQTGPKPLTIRPDPPWEFPNYERSVSDDVHRILPSHPPSHTEGKKKKGPDWSAGDRLSDWLIGSGVACLLQSTTLFATARLSGGRARGEGKEGGKKVKE